MLILACVGADFFMQTLDKAVKGVTYRIHSLDKLESCCCRLREMGVMENEHVRLLGTSPFGGPLIFSIDGVRIALRKKDCRCVEVEALEADVTVPASLQVGSVPA